MIFTLDYICTAIIEPSNDIITYFEHVRDIYQRVTLTKMIARTYRMIVGSVVMITKVD